MTRTSRNLAGFLLGWLFILALAFGMEAAHAIEFRSVGNNNPWNFQYIGSSGSDLCNQLRAARQATANSDQTLTVETVPTLTRTSITGQCTIKTQEPCTTDYRGITTCPMVTTTPATTYYSRCTSTDPWVQITPTAPTCAPPTPPQCTEHPAGTERTIKLPSSLQPAYSTCVSNCQFTGSGFDFGDGYYMVATSTGAYCDATQTGQALTPTGVSIPTDAGTFTPAPASQQEPGKKGCGTLNGEYVCLGEPTGTGKCTLLSNGGGFCVTVTNKPKTPDQKPDNGTPGTEAAGGTPVTVKEPDANAAFLQNAAQTTIYNNTTINQSTNQGTGGGSSSGSSSGSSTSSSSGGSTSSSSGSSSGSSSSSGGSGGSGEDDGGGKCGAPGQPVCAVKIDPTGIPSEAGAISTQALTDAISGAQTGLSDRLSAPDPLLSWGGVSAVMAMIPAMPYASCQSMTFTVWGGKTMTFPGERGCQGLEKLKTFESWLLTVWTIISCVFVLLRPHASSAKE